MEVMKGVFSRFFCQRENWSLAQLENNVRIIGNLEAGRLARGLEYEFHGEWTVHPKYGRQFKVATFRQLKPRNPKDVVKYLAHIGKGIGEARAKALVNRWGAENVIEILREDPDRIAEEEKGSASWVYEASDSIREVYEHEEARIELYALLHGRGFPQDTIDALVEMYGIAAADKIKADPFLMVEHGIRGASFNRVDTLYLELGHPIDGMRRQSMAVLYYLDTEPRGSVWVTRDYLEQAMYERIGAGLDVVKAIDAVYKEGMVTLYNNGTEYVAKRELAYAESVTASKVAEMLCTGQDS